MHRLIRINVFIDADKTFYMAEDRDKKWNIKRKTDCLLNNFLLNLLFL